MLDDLLLTCLKNISLRLSVFFFFSIHFGIPTVCTSVGALYKSINPNIGFHPTWSYRRPPLLVSSDIW